MHGLQNGEGSPPEDESFHKNTERDNGCALRAVFAGRHSAGPGHDAAFVSYGGYVFPV